MFDEVIAGQSELPNDAVTEMPQISETEFDDSSFSGRYNEEQNTDPDALGGEADAAIEAIRDNIDIPLEDMSPDDVIAAINSKRSGGAK